MEFICSKCVSSSSLLTWARTPAGRFELTTVGTDGFGGSDEALVLGVGEVEDDDG